jgi:two-component system, OmpR family, response regulator
LTHRILIVDDELHIREVIRVALKKAGMTVSEARDGKEALSRFANDRPDLVVLDIGMRDSEVL